MLNYLVDLIQVTPIQIRVGCAEEAYGIIKIVIAPDQLNVFVGAARFIWPVNVGLNLYSWYMHHNAYAPVFVRERASEFDRCEPVMKCTSHTIHAPQSSQCYPIKVGRVVY